MDEWRLLTSNKNRSLLSRVLKSVLEDFIFLRRNLARRKINCLKLILLCSP